MKVTGTLFGYEKAFTYTDKKTGEIVHAQTVHVGFKQDDESLGFTTLKGMLHPDDFTPPKDNKIPCTAVVDLTVDSNRGSQVRSVRCS